MPSAVERFAAAAVEMSQDMTRRLKAIDLDEARLVPRMENLEDAAREEDSSRERWERRVIARLKALESNSATTTEADRLKEALKAAQAEVEALQTQLARLQPGRPRPTLLCAPTTTTPDGSKPSAPDR